MRKDIRRRYDAHVRTNNVCAEHSEFFATPGGRKMRATLGACLAVVDRLQAVQARCVEERRAATAQRRVARRALCDGLRAVVVVGKLVELDETTMATMRIPRMPSDLELIAYAQGLLNRVLPYADAFVAEGLPSDILKNIEVSMHAIAAARDAQAAARQQFTAAAVSIHEAQTRAARTVNAFYAIAVNLPAAHPEFLTKLRMARRVGPHVDSAAKPEPALSLVPLSVAPIAEAA
jgi:hypothetical protein